MAWARATRSHAKREYETVDDDSDFAKRAPSNVGGTPRERLHTGHTQGLERRGARLRERGAVQAGWLSQGCRRRHHLAQFCVDPG